MPAPKRLQSSGPAEQRFDVAAILGSRSNAGGSGSGKKAYKADLSSAKKVAALTEMQGGEQNPLLRMLSELDKPRAAVVSTINQADNLISGDGFNVAELLEGINHNIGFGEYLDKQFAGWDEQNRWLQRGVGFIGDVALDPLTYLSAGGTAAGKVTAKEIAEETVQAAARGAVSEQAAKEAIEALGKKGTAQVLGRTAHKEVADALGYAGGVQFKAPGFNTFGRITKMDKVLQRTAYGRKFGKGIQIVGKGENAAAIAETIAKPFQVLRNRKTVATMRRGLSRTGEATNTLFRKGAGAEERWAAANVIGGLADQRVGELMFKARHTQGMVDILQDAKKLGMDDEDFMRALQSTAGAAPLERAAIDPAKMDLLDRGRTWLDGVRNDINKMAGKEIISDQEMYAPGMLESKFRDAFREVRQSRSTTGNTKVFAEKGRKFREGTVLHGVDANGEKVRYELLNPLEAGGKSIRDQAEDFYREIHGDDFIPIFNNKAHEVLPVYLEAMSRVAGREKAGQLFQRTGVGRRVIDALENQPDVADRLVTRAADLDGNYDSLALDVESAGGRSLKNDARLDDLRAQAQADNVKPHVADEITAREEAQSLYAKADEAEAQVQEMLNFGGPESTEQAIDLQGQALVHRLEADDWVEYAKELRTGPRGELGNLATITDADLAKATELMDEAVHQFAKPAMWGRTTQVDQSVVDMMTDYARFNDPESLRGFLRYYDAGTQYLKRQQLASIGYLVRNYMGGKFMHWMDGIELGAEARYLRAIQQEAAGKIDELDDVTRAGIEALNEYGLRRTGQVAHEYDRNIFDRVNPNPLSKNFAVYRGIAKGNDLVEDTLRGTHFLDAYRQGIGKGLEHDVAARAAYDRVIKYHFDYGDLSGFESNVVKRVIPFYTWSRKAIPTMLEDMVRKPGKINNYFNAKRNIEDGTPYDSIVPEWFTEAGAIRLPFRTTDNAGQMYVMPDLPINAIDKYMGSDIGGTVQDSLSQVSPIIKTPLEMWRSKQFFKGIPLGDKPEPIPEVYRAIPGLAQALQAVGVVDRNADGQLVIKGRHSYFVDQFIPLLARGRRLAPNEERYQQRLLGSWASFLGMGLRENTMTAQESEIWRRYFNAKDELARQQELGFASDRDKVDINEFFPGGAPSR